MELISYLLGKKSSGGGSSGLEYEEGTYTPTEDTERPTIQFRSVHEKLPVLVLIVDASGYTPNNYIVSWYYNDIEKFGGNAVYNGKYYTYTEQKMTYINEYGNLTYFTGNQNFSSDEEKETASYPRFYVTESCFKPGTIGNNSKKPFMANNTYKWVAIWK